MARLGKVVYFFFKASWNVLESLFFVLGTSLHAYLLRVIVHSRANFFSGMRWQWTWNDCELIRQSFARQLFEFFLLRETTVARIRAHLELSHGYFTNLGYITAFYLLRSSVGPYFAGYFFYVFFGVLCFYWYSVCIQIRPDWFTHFLAQVLTAFVFITAAKFIRVYLAFTLAVVFRFLSLQLSCLLIAFISASLGDILDYLNLRPKHRFNRV